MAHRDPRLFNPDRVLLLTNYRTVHGFPMAPNAPLTIVDNPEGEGEVTKDTAVRLWVSNMAHYADDATATAVETPQAYAARVVKMEELGGGHYLITAPWLPEGLKVQGKRKANAEYEAIIAKGDTKGVTVEVHGGGWYTVKAPWAEEGERVQGQERAEALEQELIAQGPPADWKPEGPGTENEEGDADPFTLGDVVTILTGEHEGKDAAVDRFNDDGTIRVVFFDNEELSEAAVADADLELKESASEESELTFSVGEPDDDGLYPVSGPALAEPRWYASEDEAAEAAASFNAFLSGE